MQTLLDYVAKSAPLATVFLVLWNMYDVHRLEKQINQLR